MVGKKKFLRYLGIIAGCLLAIGCSGQNSINSSDASVKPSPANEKVASVTTPQGEIQTVKTPNGSLCIFMRGANGLLYYKKQNSATGFPSNWTQIAGSSRITGNIATYCSGAYPIYVFSLNAYGYLVVTKQYSDGGAWTTWTTIGTRTPEGYEMTINSDVAVAGDWDGCINVFARSSLNNKLYNLKQSGRNGTFPSFWYGPMRDAQVGPKIAVVKHMNFTPTNGLTVFYGSDEYGSSGLSKKTAGMDYFIHAIHQFASVGWVYDPIVTSPLVADAFATGGSIIAGNFADGRMIVFGISNGASQIFYVYETTPGQQGWTPRVVFSGGEGSSAREPLALGKNADGRLELFSNAFGSDGDYYRLRHRWQTAPNGDWSENPFCGDFRTAVFNPNASIWGTRIVVDRFQNGTLAAFAQTTQFPDNPIGYTNFNCNYDGCWLPGPISLGNP
jgi:hypothetical protein